MDIRRKVQFDIVYFTRTFIEHTEHDWLLRDSVFQLAADAAQSISYATVNPVYDYTYLAIRVYIHTQSPYSFL